MTESARSSHLAEKKILLCQCRTEEMWLSSYSNKKNSDFRWWHSLSQKWEIPLTKIVKEISGHINRSTVSVMWEGIVFCLALITPYVEYLAWFLVSLQIGVGLTLVNITSLVSLNGFPSHLKIISELCSMGLPNLSAPPSTTSFPTTVSLSP